MKKAFREAIQHHGTGEVLRRNDFVDLARKMGLGYLRLNYGNLPQEPEITNRQGATQPEVRASDEWVLKGVRRYSQDIQEDSLFIHPHEIARE